MTRGKPGALNTIASTIETPFLKKRHIDFTARGRDDIGGMGLSNFKATLTDQTQRYGSSSPYTVELHPSPLPFHLLVTRLSIGYMQDACHAALSWNWEARLLLPDIVDCLNSVLGPENVRGAFIIVRAATTNRKFGFSQHHFEELSTYLPNLAVFRDYRHTYKTTYSLCRFLAEPIESDNGSLSWWFPMLQELDLSLPKFSNEAISLMVQKRYGATEGAPKALKRLNLRTNGVALRRIVDEIVPLLGEGVFTWNQAPPDDPWECWGSEDDIEAWFHL